MKLPPEPIIWGTKTAFEEIKDLQLRHAAVMLHTQTVVDENTKLRDIMSGSLV